MLKREDDTSSMTPDRLQTAFWFGNVKSLHRVTMKYMDPAVELEREFGNICQIFFLICLPKMWILLQKTIEETL